MAVMAALALVVTGIVGNAGAGVPDSCFGSLGCFSNGAPWTTLLRPVPPPKSPAFINTQYYLYTRNAPNRFVVSHPSDGIYSVNGSDFDGSRPTIFFVHGFNTSGTNLLSTVVKDALVAKSDANVIVVDWAKGASNTTYLQSVSNARIVAATTAQLLKYLIASKGVDLAKVHLIGFSLGAQVVGYVGKAVPNIGRITALDAAQPGFEGYGNVVSLNVDDAVYVDAIHTDARPFVPTHGSGFIRPVGDVDFYVNGGWNQPACQWQLPSFTNLTDFGNAASIAIDESSSCRHRRGVELFVASLTMPNCRFWGHQINSWQRTLVLVTGDWASMFWRTPCDQTTCSEMGFDSIHYPARGSFDVATGKTAPYCLPDDEADEAMAPFHMRKHRGHNSTRATFRATHAHGYNRD